MAQSYPSVRYRRDGATTTLQSAEEEQTLGKEWADSPAAFGVETHPGKTPDPDIAKNLKPAKPVKD